MHSCATTLNENLWNPGQPRMSECKLELETLPRGITQAGNRRYLGHAGIKHIGSTRGHFSTDAFSVIGLCTQW